MAGMMIPGADKASRVRTFGITDQSVDLHNTTFALDGWDFSSRFMRNPLVLLQHGFINDDLPVLGRSSLPKRVGDRIEAEVEMFPISLAPEADRVLGMVDAGVLGASIRASPDYATAEYNEDRETGDDWLDFFYPPLDFKRQTLTEWSVVVLGSNGNAVPAGRVAQAGELELLARLGLHGRALGEKARATASRDQAHALALVKNLPERLRKLVARPELADGKTPPDPARGVAPVPVQVSPPVPVERVLELADGLSLEKLGEMVGGAVDARASKRVEEELRVQSARRRGSLSLE
jgi:hypothetical protein